MNILVIGSGGREHALAWRIAQSPRAGQVFVAPGNAGTAQDPRLSNVALNSIPELVVFAREQNIAFTVVGPEAPLAAGVVDAFRAAGLRIFGPTQYAAQLESSKDFAKAFMQRHGIPTAGYETFTDAAAAVDAFVDPALAVANSGRPGSENVHVDHHRPLRRAGPRNDGPELERARREAFPPLRQSRQSRYEAGAAALPPPPACP